MSSLGYTVRPSIREKIKSWHQIFILKEKFKVGCRGLVQSHYGL